MRRLQFLGTNSGIKIYIYIQMYVYAQFRYDEFHLGTHSIKFDFISI